MRHRGIRGQNSGDRGTAAKFSAPAAQNRDGAQWMIPVPCLYVPISAKPWSAYIRIKKQVQVKTYDLYLLAHCKAAGGRPEGLGPFVRVQRPTAVSPETKLPAHAFHFTCTCQRSRIKNRFAGIHRPASLGGSAEADNRLLLLLFFARGCRGVHSVRHQPHAETEPICKRFKSQG